jgi:hypothetical protein
MYPINVLWCVFSIWVILDDNRSWLSCLQMGIGESPKCQVFVGEKRCLVLRQGTCRLICIISYLGFNKIYLLVISYLGFNKNCLNPHHVKLYQHFRIGFALGFSFYGPIMTRWPVEIDFLSMLLVPQIRDI